MPIEYSIDAIKGNTVMTKMRSLIEWSLSNFHAVENWQNTITGLINTAITQSATALTKSNEALGGIFSLNNRVAQALTFANFVSNPSTVNLKFTKENKSILELAMPVASATQSGILNSATYIGYQQLGNRVSVLENKQSAYPVVFANTSPSQADILAVYNSTYASAPTIPLTGTTVVDYAKNLQFTYDGSTWINSTAGIIPIATDSVPGIVKGSNVAGQIAVETDGTMSLNGYDAINIRFDAVDETATQLANVTARIVDETATQLANVTAGIESKLDKNLGVNNAYKSLSVGVDGNVVCSEASSNVEITYSNISQIIGTTTQPIRIMYHSTIAAFYYSPNADSSYPPIYDRYVLSYADGRFYENRYSKEIYTQRVLTPNANYVKYVVHPDDATYYNNFLNSLYSDKQLAYLKSDNDFYVCICIEDVWFHTNLKYTSGGNVFINSFDCYLMDPLGIDATITRYTNLINTGNYYTVPTGSQIYLSVNDMLPLCSEDITAAHSDKATLDYNTKHGPVVKHNFSY